jgi:hypothetical protein
LGIPEAPNDCCQLCSFHAKRAAVNIIQFVGSKVCVYALEGLQDSLLASIGVQRSDLPESDVRDASEWIEYAEDITR